MGSGADALSFGLVPALSDAIGSADIIPSLSSLSVCVYWVQVLLLLVAKVSLLAVFGCVGFGCGKMARIPEHGMLVLLGAAADCLCLIVYWVLKNKLTFC